MLGTELVFGSEMSRLDCSDNGHINIDSVSDSPRQPSPARHGPHTQLFACIFLLRPRGLWGPGCSASSYGDGGQGSGRRAYVPEVIQLHSGTAELEPGFLASVTSFRGRSVPRGGRGDPVAGPRWDLLGSPGCKRSRGHRLPFIPGRQPGRRRERKEASSRLLKAPQSWSRPSPLSRLRLRRERTDQPPALSRPRHRSPSPMAGLGPAPAQAPD